MSVSSVKARSFILALFIRDDNKRFLLGDNGYDFKDDQLHFAGNTIENDEVVKQGADGVFVAGQVRRASVQSFDGYVGDGTTTKPTIEQMRRDFIAFFAKGHHFRVVYVDCNKDAWQRKGGYLVDAPEVQELWQIHPEYHVALNFEDVNYYEYDENEEGEEILSNILTVPISDVAEGGLEWDNDGAISEGTAEYSEPKTESGTAITLTDAVYGPIADISVKGNTSQQTYTGKNLLNLKAATYNTRGITTTVDTITGEMSFSGTTNNGYPWLLDTTASMPAGSYVISIDHTLSYQIVFRFYYDSSNYTEGGVNAGSTTRTITLPNATIRIVALYNVQSGVNIGSNTAKPMVVAGSTPGEFEPYVGGKASPNPDYPQAVKTTTGYNKLEICGKNVLNYGPYLRASSSGLTFTYNSDGTLTIANTSSATWHNVTSVFDSYLPAGSYTFSIDHALTFKVYLSCWYQDGTSTDLTINAGSTSANTTFANDVRRIQLNFSNMTGGQAYNDTIKLQLEQGLTATDFDPYQGQSYEVNLGKNMLDLSTFAVGGMANGSAQPDMKYRINNAANPIKVEPNTTYSISCVLGDTVKGFRVGVHSLSGSKAFVSDSGWKQLASSPATITTGATTEYIAIVCSLSTTSANVTTNGTENMTVCASVDDFMRGAELQTELGSATDFAPYFTPIELCKIGTYQDSIYKSGGKWYLHKAVGKNTLSSSSNWHYNSGSHGFSIQFSADRLFSAYAGFCTHAVVQTSSVTWTGVGKCGWNTSNTFWFEDGGAVATSAAEFKTWLDSNVVNVYYVLATPTDTEITDASLIGQLDDILANGQTYYGNTNITTAFVAGNAQGELSITYYTKSTPISGYVWEEGGSGGPTIVMVDSITNVLPVWTVYGPVLNPQLENVTSGDVIQYVGMIAEGQTLTVDMGEQTASLDGLNVLSDMVGEWLELMPGSNTLLFNADSPDAPNSEIGWSEIVG